MIVHFGSQERVIPKDQWKSWTPQSGARDGGRGAGDGDYPVPLRRQKFRQSRKRRRGYIDSDIAACEARLSACPARQYTLSGALEHLRVYMQVSAALFQYYGTRSCRAARFHRKCEERRFYDSVASTLGVDRNTVLCIGDGYLGGKGRHAGVMPTGLKVCLCACVLSVRHSHRVVTLTCAACLCLFGACCFIVPPRHHDSACWRCWARCARYCGCPSS